MKKLVNAVLAISMLVTPLSAATASVSNSNGPTNNYYDQSVTNTGGVACASVDKGAVQNDFSPTNVFAPTSVNLNSLENKVANTNVNLVDVTVSPKISNSNLSLNEQAQLQQQKQQQVATADASNSGNSQATNVDVSNVYKSARNHAPVMAAPYVNASANNLDVNRPEQMVAAHDSGDVALYGNVSFNKHISSNVDGLDIRIDFSDYFMYTGRGSKSRIIAGLFDAKHTVGVVHVKPHSAKDMATGASVKNAVQKFMFEHFSDNYALVNDHTTTIKSVANRSKGFGASVSNSGTASNPVRGTVDAVAATISGNAGSTWQVVYAEYEFFVLQDF